MLFSAGNIFDKPRHKLKTESLEEVLGLSIAEVRHSEGTGVVELERVRLVRGVLCACQHCFFLVPICKFLNM